MSLDGEYGITNFAANLALVGLVEEKELSFSRL